MAKGLQIANIPGTNDCGLGNGDLILYAVPGPNSNMTECDLRCIDGWYRDDANDQSPKVGCTVNNNATSPTGNTTYYECNRTWYIMGVSHKGIMLVTSLLTCCGD